MPSFEALSAAFLSRAFAANSSAVGTVRNAGAAALFAFSLSSARRLLAFSRTDRQK
jgi:hypothetical protein